MSYEAERQTAIVQCVVVKTYIYMYVYSVLYTYNMGLYTVYYSDIYMYKYRTCLQQERRTCDMKIIIFMCYDLRKDHHTQYITC